MTMQQSFVELERIGFVFGSSLPWRMGERVRKSVLCAAVGK